MIRNYWIAPQDYVSPPNKIHTLGSIATIIADEIGITVFELRSKGRKREFVTGRALLVYFADKLGCFSKRSVWEYVNFDHSSEIYHRGNTVKLISVDKKLKQLAQRISQKLIN